MGLMRYTDLIKQQLEIATDRQESYGSATDNFINISNIVMINFGLDMSEIDICKVMIAMKIAREKHSHKRDNLIDLANYTLILEELETNLGIKE